MDLLCAPDPPSIPISKTPYVCEEIWDGGLFLAYPRRQGRMGTIPQHLRTGYLTPNEPYVERANPTPEKEQQRLYQTWLFFGLVAEFLGLNEHEDGSRLVDVAYAKQQIASLHQDCILTEAGQRYLTGVKLLGLAYGSLFNRTLHAAFVDKSRLKYLSECLRVTYFLMEWPLSAFDETIKFSIAALGNYLSCISSNVAIAISYKEVSVLWFGKPSRYLQRHGQLETRMLESGWCTSDIERIRSSEYGLNTVHYLSRLTKSPSQLDHSKCNIHLCIASQIDPRKYSPRHITTQSCSCGHINVDESLLEQILHRNSAYPVLNLEKLGERDMIEEYSPNIPYVAISHVWADGLGNPTSNCLPQCQMKRIADLIANLQKNVEASSNLSKSVRYRLWLDTLLCPINLAGKKIALQRMPDVYRNATHVLVLDASLSLYKSEKAHPVELGLRAFGCSNWMRRLWTLQEGALSKSLYFQFADRAIQTWDLVNLIYQQSMEDARLMDICKNMMDQCTLVHNFFPNNILEQYKGAMPNVDLLRLQQALLFRSVSVPADEALCVAALLSLDVKEVTGVEDAQGRIIRLWELISKKYGRIPANIVFYVGDAIDKPGWRWAPRSFLNWGSDDGLDSTNRCARFNITFSPSPDLVPTGPNLASLWGVPTPLGLRVQFPGTLVHTRPRISGMPLHPWAGLFNNTRPGIVWARKGEAGKWFRIVPIIRDPEPCLSLGEQPPSHGKPAYYRLCEMLDSHRCVLVYSPYGPRYLLAEIAGANTTATTTLSDGAMHVRSITPAFVLEADAAGALVADTLQKLAKEIAEDSLTKTFSENSHEGACTTESRLLVEQLQKDLQDKMVDACDSSPEFAQALYNTLAPSRENLWICLVEWFSHDTILVDLPEDQIWIID